MTFLVLGDRDITASTSRRRMRSTRSIRNRRLRANTRSRTISLRRAGTSALFRAHRRRLCHGRAAPGDAGVYAVASLQNSDGVGELGLRLARVPPHQLALRFLATASGSAPGVLRPVCGRAGDATDAGAMVGHRAGSATAADRRRFARDRLPTAFGAPARVARRRLDPMVVLRNE